MAVKKPHKKRKLRTRFVFEEWDRDPNGIFLPRIDILGDRSPSGYPWGHNMDDLFLVPRDPRSVPYSAYWSRSMLAQLGEKRGNDPESIKNELDPTLYARKPRVRKPWPLLKVPLDCPIDGQEEYGLVDEGSIVHGKLRLRRNDDGGIDIFDKEDKRVETCWEGMSEYEPSEDEMEIEESINKIGPKTPLTILDAMEKPNPPKLEEFIPPPYFPDILLVHDPQSCASGAKLRTSDRKDNNTDSEDDDSDDDSDESVIRDPMGQIPTGTDSRGPVISLETDTDPVSHPAKIPPVRYIRVFPPPKSDTKLANKTDPLNLRTAEIFLLPKNLIGTGHHSYVFTAPLTLPSPLEARTPTGQVSVAAKVAFLVESARELLHNEAIQYNSFEKEVMQEYCGFESVGREPFHPTPVGAIVPKFYGYYKPDDEEVEGFDYSDWSPILLMEECGTPVVPKDLTIDEARECQTLFDRFHDSHYIHNSSYVRNIVQQAGPLTRPPLERSLLTPSFRLIDFGRTENANDTLRRTLGAKNYEWWLQDNKNYYAECRKEREGKPYRDFPSYREVERGPPRMKKTREKAITFQSKYKQMVWDERYRINMELGLRL